MSTDWRALSSCYDETYYRSHCGPIPYERNAFWLEFFHGAAENIVRSLKPRRVLDAGCAKGLLVEALWDRSVEAWGIDISAYAIGEVRKDVRPYCRQGSLAEPIEGRFDLVTCIEVLEHIAPEEARIAIRNLTGATDTILFSSTPTDLTEPTHVNVQPTISWLREFAGQGFAPDLLFDASFIAPHAFLLRRAEERPAEDVLSLFAELIRYRITLADRHRQIEHWKGEAARLESGKTAAEAEAAAARAQAQRMGEERDRQETVLAARLEQISALTSERDAHQRAYAEQTRKIDMVTGRVGRLESELESHYQAEQRRIGEAEFESRRKAAEVQAQHDAAETARREFTAAVAALTANAQSLQDASTRLGLRLGAVETRMAEVGRQVLEILHSRIWRTLCTGGAIALSPLSVLRLVSRTGQRELPPAANAEGDFYGLVCDEPGPRDQDAPRTGTMRVRGWALAKSGIERVEVSIAGQTVSAQTHIQRPDVARTHPQTPDAKTSGFTADIDVSGLASGPQTLRIKAISRAGAVQELALPIRIDHDSGYASDYDRWIAEFETRSEPLIQLKLSAFTYQPLISLVVPVYRTPADILRRAIESVIRQSYSNWQLCIADDCSRSPGVNRVLDEYAGKDDRIVVRRLESQQGIAGASNAALELAQGEFVALLDHDDELAQDALFHAIDALNARPETDLIYSDEDKIDIAGRRYEPFFKPEWSPDLLLSENYIGHFLVVRRALVERAGRFRREFDGSQDYDLALRITGVTDKIVHIPRVLYHWRSLATSTASVAAQKSYAAEAARRAIQEEIGRRTGAAAQVVPGAISGRWRVRYPLGEDPQVSIIIASGGDAELLKQNLQAVFAKTEYGRYEIVVIDNSKAGAIERMVRKWPDAPRPLRYLDWRNRPFNYSRINNEAARHCESPLLLFLNDDTTVIAGEWLRAMAEMAMRPEVGAVGAKLLYPDGRIQHAGVVMGLFENCGHAFKGLSGDGQHYFDFPDVIRNVSAVTGACLMTRAVVFQEAGGFDERTFAVAFNDIDLCLKIGQKGYRVLYSPHALLYHHEAFSKTPEDIVPHPAEVAAMQKKWKDVIAADPYYSPNLTRTAEDYSFRRKA